MGAASVWVRFEDPACCRFLGVLCFLIKIYSKTETIFVFLIKRKSKFQIPTRKKVHPRDSLPRAARHVLGVWLEGLGGKMKYKKMFFYFFSSKTKTNSKFHFFYKRFLTFALVGNEGRGSFVGLLGDRHGCGFWGGF